MAARKRASTAPVEAPDAADPTPPVVSEAKPKPVDAAPDPSPACGYIGHAPGVASNADHTIATGPDSPVLPDDRTRSPQPSAPKEA